MWCLCGCPRKNNHNNTTLSIPDDGINNNGTNNTIINPLNNPTQSVRRRSSTGYVQLVQENDLLNRESDHECESIKFLSTSPDLLVTKGGDDNNNTKMRKRKLLFFNLRPIILNRKKDLMKSKDINKTNENIEQQLNDNPSNISHTAGDDIDDEHSMLDKISHYKESLNSLVDCNSFHMKYPRRHSMSVCTKIAQSELDKPMGFIMPKLAHVHEGLLALTGDDYRSRSSILETIQTESMKHEQNHTCCYNEVAWKELARETLLEFEWCLNHLSSLTSSHTESSLSLEQFKVLMDREFSKLAENKKSKQEVIKNIKHYLESSNQNGLSPQPIKSNCLFNQSFSPKSSQSAKSKLPLVQSSTTQLQQQSTIPIQQSQTTKTTITSNNRQIPPPDLIGSNQIKHSTNEELVNKYILLNMDHEMYKEMGIHNNEYVSIDQMLDCYLESWGFQIFEFDERTNHHPLVFMVMKTFTKRNLLSLFSIDPCTLYRFFLSVEREYDSTIPYHNAVHAADVTQSIHVLLNSDGIQNVFSDLEILSVIFACAIHDVQHPGVTNQFLINIEHDLAVMYNDIAVLENHHLAVTFRLLQQKGCDVFENLSRTQRIAIRKLIIELVLATDMSRHMNLLSDLKVIAESNCLSKSTNNESELNEKNINKSKSSSNQNLSNSTNKNSDSNNNDENDNETIGSEKRLRILQNMVHCADLSNPTKPLSLYQEWTGRIMEEFFRQGDREREFGMDISPMCDRATASIEKSQVSFIDFIVAPLWSAWSQLVYPSMQTILDTLATNREWYHQQLLYPNNTNPNSLPNTTTTNTKFRCTTTTSALSSTPSSSSSTTTTTSTRHHHLKNHHHLNHHHRRHFSIEEEGELENILTRVDSDSTDSL